jgi:hypothetical protein
MTRSGLRETLRRSQKFRTVAKISSKLLSGAGQTATARESYFLLMIL